MDEREYAAEDQFLRPEPKLKDLTLHKLSAPTWLLLRRRKNKIVCPDLDGQGQPLPFNPGSEEGLYAVMEYIYVHAHPVGEVTRLMKDPDAFEAAVMELGATVLSFDELDEAMKVIDEERGAVAAAVVEPHPEEGEGRDPNLPTQPGSSKASSRSRGRQAGVKPKS